MIRCLLDGWDPAQLVRWAGYLLVLIPAIRIMLYLWLDKEQRAKEIIMAFTINHVTLVGGNLTRDAELKFSQDGKPRLNFSIAMNKGKDKPAEFFNCVFFGDMAEKIAQYMKSGTKVAIEGRLSQRRWEKDGQNHSLVEIACHNVVLLWSKQDAPAATGYSMDETPLQAQDVPGGWDDQF